jgi:hypothetical protein
MSWSTHTPEAQPKNSIVVPEPALSDRVAEEQNDQFSVALEAAKKLAEAVGRPGDEVRITLSGHANPDHAPSVGWADEMITVSVSARAREQG